MALAAAEMAVAEAAMAPAEVATEAARLVKAAQLRRREQPAGLPEVKARARAERPRRQTEREPLAEAVQAVERLELAARLA